MPLYTSFLGMLVFCSKTDKQHFNECQHFRGKEWSLEQHSHKNRYDYNQICNKPNLYKYIPPFNIHIFIRVGTDEIKENTLVNILSKPLPRKEQNVRIPLPVIQLYYSLVFTFYHVLRFIHPQFWVFTFYYILRFTYPQYWVEISNQSILLILILDSQFIEYNVLMKIFCPKF